MPDRESTEEMERYGADIGGRVNPPSITSDRVLPALLFWPRIPAEKIGKYQSGDTTKERERGLGRDQRARKLG